MPYQRLSIPDTLEARSELVAECGCQIWMGSLENKGYGRLSVGGKYLRVSRLSWIENFGPIPDGLCVLHRCDIRPCINPHHLFLGTNADNSRDKFRKGRAVVFGRKIAGAA